MANIASIMGVPVQPSAPLTRDIPVENQGSIQIEVDFIWERNITVTAIKLFTETTPTSVANDYAFRAHNADTDGTGVTNLLGAAEYRLDSAAGVLNGAPITWSAPLTGTAADLDIDAGERLRLFFDATADGGLTDLTGSGSGIQAMIYYRIRA